MNLKRIVLNFLYCFVCMTVVYFICSIKYTNGCAIRYFESDFTCSAVVFIVWAILYFVVYVILDKEKSNNKKECDKKCMNLK